jgi:hypothetical protein
MENYLLGKFRESTSKKKGNTTPIYIKPTLFYSCFVTVGLVKWKTELRTTEADISSSSSNNSGLHFKVLKLDILNLAITPLTKRGDVYLCVYMEPSVSSQEIISKIFKAI